MAFDYYMPARILFGEGKLNELHAQRLPGKKALIVISAGNSMKRLGFVDRLTGELDKAEAGYALFDKVLPNPIREHVMEGAALARKEKCDFIIGLGGGSSMDSAKAIAVMAANPGDYWDYISGGSGKGLPVPFDPLPMVAITTTAGTGTEADPWTVITSGDEKIGFGYEKTFPVLSIVDPELMLSVPPALTAYQGFDALFHSTEGYVNRTANEMSDLFALKAISLIGSGLAKAVKDGSDRKARGEVALANTLSGFVESTSGCISAHAIEHALSGAAPQLPHGAGLILISLAYYTHLAHSGACDTRMVDMARALGKSNAKTPMDFVAALKDLQEACGVTEIKLSDYGIKKGDLPALASRAREIMGGLFQVDPLPIAQQEVERILADSYR